MKQMCYAFLFMVASVGLKGCSSSAGERLAEKSRQEQDRILMLCRHEKNDKKWLECLNRNMDAPVVKPSLIKGE